MKTNEFIKKVKELGFNVEDCVDLYSNEKIIRGIRYEYKIFARVGEDRRFSFNVFYSYFEELDIATQEALFDLVVEYARTPIEEREEKKYYLRLPIFGYDDEHSYLNLECNTGKYLFGSKTNIERYQTQFTQKEIDEMKKRFNLDSFEIVEVRRGRYEI